MSARETGTLCVSAGNYKFFEMGRVLPFKVFSIANIGPSAIKVVTTALEAQTRKFSKAERSTRDLLANYLPAFTKLNKRYPVLFAFASNLPRLWRSYPIILDRLDQHLEEISLLPRRISFIIEFERSKLRFFFFAAFDKVEARRVLERGGAFTWHGPGTNAVIPGPMIRSQELSVTNVQSAASTAEIARSEVTVTLITSFQFVSGAQPRYVTGIRPFCRAKN